MWRRIDEKSLNERIHFKVFLCAAVLCVLCDMLLLLSLLLLLLMLLQMHLQFAQRGSLPDAHFPAFAAFNSQSRCAARAARRGATL